MYLSPGFFNMRPCLEACDEINCIAAMQGNKNDNWENCFIFTRCDLIEDDQSYNLYIRNPTLAPTGKPIPDTAIPTPSPTSDPTTIAPSFSPSDIPTLKLPSKVPSETPTWMPTTVPSEPPSVIPPAAPTETFTVMPTTAPTESP